MDYRLIATTGITLANDETLMLPYMKALELFKQHNKGCNNGPLDHTITGMLAHYATENKVIDLVKGGFQYEFCAELYGLLPSTHMIVFLTNTNNDLLSMAFLYSTLDTYYITYLYTPKEFRHNGYATLLVNKLFELNSKMEKAVITLSIFNTPESNDWCKKSGWTIAYKSSSNNEASYVASPEYVEKAQEYANTHSDVMAMAIKKINKDYNKKVEDVDAIILMPLHTKVCLKLHELFLTDFFKGFQDIISYGSEIKNIKFNIPTKTIMKRFNEYNTAYKQLKEMVESRKQYAKHLENMTKASKMNIKTSGKAHKYAH